MKKVFFIYSLLLALGLQSCGSEEIINPKSIKDNGMFAQINTNKGVNVKKITNSLKKFYKNKMFIKITKKNSLISTNDVINTNNCLISVCESKTKNKIIILSAIDNLIKGGSGQAIQNLNILFNFKKNMGLK